MNNQVYLFLKRKGDLSSTGLFKTAKDVIMGDSLDMPFVKWINVTGLSNSIGFSSGKVRSLVNTAKADEEPQYELQTAAYGTSAGEYERAMSIERAADEDLGGYEDLGRQAYRVRRRRINLNTRNRYESVVNYDRYHGKVTTTTRQKQINYRGTWHDQHAPEVETTYQHNNRFFTPDFDNAKLKINLPDHNEFTFTKNVDNATPQIAFAASSQEPLTHAIFAFRRRIGVGIQGVRLPYMMVYLRDCLVSSWKLDGDQETVSIQYRRVHWLTYDQVTDWNYPTGMSNRYWDVKNKKGGENPQLYIFMGLVLAAFTAAGVAAQAATTSLSSDGDNNSSSRNDKRAKIT